MTSPDLLDSYTEERHPHVDQIIKTSMALGEIVCISDPIAAAGRDEALLSGQVPPPPPFPWLTQGILAPAPVGPGNETFDDTIGHRGVQGRVATAERTGRTDDLVGNTWHVLTDDLAIAQGLGAEQRETLEAIGAQVLHVSRAHRASDSLVDLDATYHKWFTTGGFRAVVVRPDFYVYGTANSTDELNALVGRLRSQVGLCMSVPQGS